jgi:hypothetical protein
MAYVKVLAAGFVVLLCSGCSTTSDSPNYFKAAVLTGLSQTIERQQYEDNLMANPRSSDFSGEAVSAGVEAFSFCMLFSCDEDNYQLKEVPTDRDEHRIKFIELNPNDRSVLELEEFK